MFTSANKLMAVCLVAVFSMVMYGCSSSSKKATMTDPLITMPDPEPELTPAEQLAAANTALEKAQAAVAALTPSSTAEEAAAAYGALAAARTAVHAATSLPANQIAGLNSQITKLTQHLDVVVAVNAARDAIDGLTNESTDADVDAANTMVTAARTALTDADALDADVTAGLESQVAGVESQVAHIQANRPDPALTKAAGTKVKAINKEADETGEDDADIGGTGATTYMRTIERDNDGTTVKITDSALGDDDPKFAKMADVAGNGGFSGSMHVRAMEENDDGETVSEVVIVHTDIAAPKATAFAKVTGQMLDVDLDTTKDADNDGDITNDFTALEVDETSSDVRKLVMADAFAPGAGTETELTFAYAQADGDGETPGNQPVEAFETAGTYNGAMGTYRCNGTAACTVTLNAKGGVTELSDGWIFTPDKGATSDVADDEFLSYGFWLKRTMSEKDGTVYNEVETFAVAEGIAIYPTSDVDNVMGTATYTGGAAGVYVKNVLDEQANIVSATSGHFTADVELNASFGGGNVAPNNQFTIDGGIRKFTLNPTGGSGPEDNDWEVGLGLADFSGGRVEGGGPGSSHTNEFSGVATGDSTAVAGSWNGTFYGAGGDTRDTEDDAAKNHPVAVIGEFNANFTDGIAAGGLGANKD